jgi:hypothetical protein
VADIIRKFDLTPEQCQVLTAALRDYLRRHESVIGDSSLEAYRGRIEELLYKFDAASGVTLEELFEPASDAVFISG